MSEKENNLEKILKDLELDEVLTSVKSDGDRSTENFYERPLEPPKRRNSLSEEQNKASKKKPDKSAKDQKKNNNKKKKPSDAKDKKTKGKKEKHKKAGLKNFFAFLKSKIKAIPPKAKRAIYKLITSNPKVTTAQMADKLNVSTRQVQKYLKRLTEQNLIVKEGSRINGSWKILDEEYTDFFGRI